MTAYYHHMDIGSFVAHTIARGLIYRSVWALTRGMDPLTIVLITAVAVGILWAIMRRRW